VRRALPAGLQTVMSLLPLSGGDLLVAAADPWLGRLGPDGTPRWTQPSLLADFADQDKTLAISPDGTVVDFGFVQGGREPARFELGSLTLAVRTAADGRTAPPKQDGLPVDGWNGTYRPTLNGSLLPLDPYERSRSLALHPNGDRFVLGTNWALRAFDAKGNALWRQPTPGVVWAVNVTGDGRLAVAAHVDGTIRWHRMDDGREILAFMPFADRTNWVAWTPEGFYAASPGAHGVLRWVVNQPDWQPAKDYAVADMLQKGDTLVAAKLDRVFRSAGDCLDVVETLKARGVSLFLLDLNGGADDVSGNGIARLFLTIVSAFAEFERDRIGERIRATKRAQKARGEYLGGRPPFGYSYDAEHRLVPVPEQQAALRRIRKLAAEGLSPYKIADDLASRDVKLSHVTIRKIVSADRPASSS
jgi:Resolvase, N terminal domain